MKLYKDSANLWHMGNVILPAGSCQLVVDGTFVKIEAVGGGLDYFNAEIHELQNEAGTAYTSVANLLTDCGDFFAKASVGSGGGVTSVNTKTGVVVLSAADVGAGEDLFAKEQQK